MVVPMAPVAGILKAKKRSCAEAEATDEVEAQSSQVGFYSRMVRDSYVALGDAFVQAFARQEEYDAALREAREHADAMCARI